MKNSQPKRKPAWHVDVCIVRPSDQDRLIERVKAGNSEAKEIATAVGSYLHHQHAGLKCACCSHLFGEREEPGAVAAMTMTELKAADPIRAVAFGICMTCARKEELRAMVYSLIMGFFPAGDCEILAPRGHA